MTTLFEPLTNPTAAQLNELADQIAMLEAVHADVGRQFMAAEWNSPGSRWIFRHHFRWLLYNSTGQLEDLSGVNAAVSLPDPNDPNEIGVLDLNTVTWLAPGMLYRVTGCQWVMEVEL